MDNYQKASILQIYGDNINTNQLSLAENYYIQHSTILNGIEVADKITPINSAHSINNIIDESTFNTINKDNLSYTPLLVKNYHKNVDKLYKLISAKDIDYENAYLKYVSNQISEYKNPITYLELIPIKENDKIVDFDIIEKQTYSYLFTRGITSYMNNTYDFVNILDYLLNRYNALKFLMTTIRAQRDLVDTKKLNEQSELNETN